MIRSFSKTGGLHRDRREENQDAVLSGESGRFLALALADGMSSCRAAEAGAHTACRVAVDLLLAHGSRFLTFSGHKTAALLLTQILSELAALAGGDGMALEDYSSTLACVLLDKEAGRAVHCNVGDSLILAAGEHGCRVVAMPDSRRDGCCATTTAGAAGQARAGSFDTGAYHSILLCSDGAWRLMYEKNRLYPAVRRLLLRGDYGGLGGYLDNQDCRDDCTFLSFEKERKQRKLPVGSCGVSAYAGRI